MGSDDIIGKRPIDLVTKDESSRVGALLEHAMAEKAPITALEKEAKHKDGHSVFLEMNGFPLFDASGKFLGYRGIDRDITGRKRSKEAIDESRRRAEESMGVIQDREIKIKELDDSIEKLKAAQSQRDSEITSIRETLAKNQEELGRAEGSLERLKAALEQRDIEISTNRSLLDGKEADLRAKQDEISGLTGSVKAKQSELDALKADLEAKMAEMEKVAASLEEKNIELNRTLTEKEKEISGLDRADR